MFIVKEVMYGYAMSGLRRELLFIQLLVGDL